MKSFHIILALVALISATTAAQQLPQFAYDDYAGWNYNNPGVALTPGNIAGGKIFLYVGQDGHVLKLTSTKVCCTGLDSIKATINWYTPSFRNPDFDLSRTALTLAIDDSHGTPIDSVTCTPTTTGTSRHSLNLAIAVPGDADSIQMRMVCWQANVLSSGAIKQASFEAVIAPSQPAMLGDVDGDGELSVSDVVMMINHILGTSMLNDTSQCDLDHDGDVNVSDVTRLIAMILGRLP